MNEGVSDFPQSIRTPPPVEWLSFSGKAPDNVLLFAQAVHRFAFAHGRHENDAWMAAYAYGCLTDTALDWFEDLDTDVQRDWSTLRHAMIKKFRRNKFAHSAPAVAVGPRLVEPSSTSRARVMMVKDNGVVLGYLSPPKQNAYATIETKPEDAVVLEVPTIKQSSQSPVTLLRIATSEKTEVSHPFYGIEGHGDWFDLKACDAGRDGAVFKGHAQALTTTAAPVAVSKVWSIHKLDDSTEEIRAQWPDDNGNQISLQAVNYPSTQDIWMRQSPIGSQETLKLVLERF